MSVSVWYCTESAIPSETIGEIQRRFGEASSGYVWWCENIELFPPKGESAEEVAQGSTKLLCNIDDEATDRYMAYLDLQHLVSIIEAASKATSTSWMISIEGDQIGCIENGIADDDLTDNVDDFIDIYPGDTTAVAARPRQEILNEFANR